MPARVISFAILGPLEQLAASLVVMRAAVLDWWRDWVNMAALNLAWMLCWVTVVLGPPATLVTFRVARDFVAGESLHPRELPGLLARDFGRGWLWMLPNALVMAGVWLNLQFYAQLAGSWAPALQLLSLLVGAGWLALQFYVLPYLVRQDRPLLGRAYRNALFTALSSPAFSLALVSVVVMILLSSFRFPVLLFLGGPMLVAVLATHAVSERLETFEIFKRERQGP